MWGIAAVFGGVLSSVFFHFNEYGCRIGHDALATNKLVETSIVFDHGVSSLVCGAAAVAVALGCCALRGLSPLGVKGPSSPWNLIIGGGDFLNSTLDQIIYSYWNWVWISSSGCWLYCRYQG